MQRYAITIAYDGSDYCGWQIQPHGRSIAQTMEEAFAKTFGTSIKLVGASRTDAGVHAMGQIGAFTGPTHINTETLMHAWNNNLPADIIIRTIQPVANNFQPRYHVNYKIYYYHFFTSRPLPFVQRYGVYLPYELNFEKLDKALQIFSGTHDFESFCSNKGDKKTIKTIDMISLIYIKRYNMFRIVIRGSSFLHHMIRRMVGAALHIASYQHLEAEYIQEKLLSNRSELAFPTAPAKGLMLYKINYKKETL